MDAFSPRATPGNSANTIYVLMFCLMMLIGCGHADTIHDGSDIDMDLWSCSSVEVTTKVSSYKL